MSQDVYIPGATQAWLTMLKEVYIFGQQVTVRNLDIVEVLHRSCKIDMKNPIISVKDRKLGLGFLMAEAAWIISGRNDVASIRPYSKRIAEFSDDGYFFRGAYGPQIVQQLSYILENLQNDLYSRQAVISIWKPSPPKSKDIPCTITVQFMVRAGLLHTFVNMRSSDCWLGVPYDWFNFSMLSRWVLLALKQAGVEHLDLGFLHFNAASQHIYKNNFMDVSSIIHQESPDWDTRTDSLMPFIEKAKTPQDLILTLWELAYSQIATGEKENSSSW
ncbi:MAG TPA: thymidylate synthase [Vitreimonas sp.]|nr:thymidylate synthase [Vitreimonas sp.]